MSGHDRSECPNEDLIRGLIRTGELTPLQSSWRTCRVFRAGLESDDDALVYKLWKTEPEQARASREAEVMNMITSAGFVGAARLHGTFVIFSGGAEVVITSYPYVRGGSLRDASPRDVSVVARLAAALHSVPVSAGSLRRVPPRPTNLGTADPYLDSAERDILAHLWEAGMADAAEFGLCYVHGDLNSENVILDSHRSDAPVLIDFEFSRLDSPLWDLASFTLERDRTGAFTVMAENEYEPFLNSYSAVIGTPGLCDRLRTVLPAFRVLYLHRVLADVSASPALARHAAGLIRTLLPQLAAWSR